MKKYAGNIYVNSIHFYLCYKTLIINCKKIERKYITVYINNEQLAELRKELCE